MAASLVVAERRDAYAATTIPMGSVTTAKLATNAVTTVKLQDGDVTGTKAGTAPCRSRSSRSDGASR
jgi:hypothetical protein